MAVIVGTFEAKPGRPRSPRCKRGHVKQLGETRCLTCKKTLDRLRYLDPERRKRKQAYQRQYRADFKDQFGFGLSSL